MQMENLLKKIVDLPIIDYHNHLSIEEIKANKRFTSIYDLWIKPDPYKHRAMRMCGVDERYITGDAPEFEKFETWCKIFPDLLGNPLYSWSKQELELFGITASPNCENAGEIYKQANEFLENNEFTVDSILKKFNVEFLCPCAEITDDVSAFNEDERIAPSLRADSAVAPTFSYIKTLEKVWGSKISNLTDYKSALCSRLDEFSASGCKFADHALDNGFVYYEDDGKNAKRFNAILKGKKENDPRLSSYLLTFLSKEYAQREFVLQLHIGAERFTSSRLRSIAGPTGGFAGIGSQLDITSIIKLIDVLDQQNALPKTIIFPLNPADYAAASVLAGSFSKDGVSGLITLGPAWWWCDHRYGIETALDNTASFGLLSNFVGMTTDSRSFLSFSRHKYFREILFEFLMEKYNKNQLMCEIKDLENLAYKMCYENIKKFIGGK